MFFMAEKCQTKPKKKRETSLQLLFDFGATPLRGNVAFMTQLLGREMMQSLEFWGFSAACDESEAVVL